MAPLASGASVLNDARAQAKRAANRAARRTEWQVLGLIVLVEAVGLTLFSVGSVLLFNPYADASALALGAGLGISALMGVPLVAQNVVPPLYERRQLRAIGRGEHELSALTPYEFARVSPIHIFVPIGVVGPFAVLVLFLTRGPANEGLKVFMMGAGGTLQLFSFAYHCVPNSRRSTKYGAYLTGVVLFGLSFNASKRPDSWDVAVDLVLILAMALCFALMRVRLRPTEPLAAGDESTARAFRWRRRAMAYGPQPGWAFLVWWAIISVPIVGSLFWAARIYSKERLARAPVLYLRAFGNQDAPRILGEVIAPAVSHISVLVTLIHPSQTAAVLKRRTHEGWMPLTFGVSNDTWRAWYLEQLEGALAVVLDAGVLSEHTRWELEAAARVLGRDRVMLIGPPGTVEALPDYWVIEYDSADMAVASRLLARWTVGHVLSRFGASDDSGAVERIVAGPGDDGGNSPPDTTC